jgi:hypothetical protein
MPSRPSAATGTRTAEAREPAVGQVREDAQADDAAGDLLDHRGEALDERVDGVRAHRVAGVDDHVEGRPSSRRAA